MSMMIVLLLYDYTIDVGLRLGDAIDPFHLANGFEAVIGNECQERSNHPFFCVPR